MAQRLKRLPGIQETRVPSLGREDPLKKEMATHFSILAWRIPWTEESGGLQSKESQRVGHNRVTKPTSPHQVEEVNCVLPTCMETPDPLEPKG